MAGPTDGAARPLARVAVGMAVALLAFAGYWLTRGPAEDASLETAARPSEREREREGAAERGETPDEAAPVLAYDPARLAPLLLDGGSAPMRLADLDGRLTPLPSGAPHGVDPAPPVREAEPSAASRVPLVEWRREPTVESDLRRAVFLRGLLDGQIDALREQADAARARGDAVSAARYERRLERLARERPGIEAHIGALEAEAPAEAPDDDQGSY